jgi:hypothetical protein
LCRLFVAVFLSRSELLVRSAASHGFSLAQLFSFSARRSDLLFPVGAIASVLVVYFAYLRWIRLPLPVLIFLARGHRAKISLVLCLGKARSVLSWTSSIPVQVLYLGHRISVGEASHCNFSVPAPFCCPNSSKFCPCLISSFS